jgi:hypothetical protein
MPMNRTVLILLVAAHGSVLAGQERMTILSRDGAVVASADGRETEVRIDPAVDALLATPGAHLTITHNHPHSVGLSAHDLEQLAKAGVETIEAIGADGSRYEASAGPWFDRDRFASRQYPAALAEVTRQLRAQVRADELRACDDHIAHLVAIALHKAEVIRYRAALSRVRLWSFRTHDIVFGHVIEAAAARLRHDDAR